MTDIKSNMSHIDFLSNEKFIAWKLLPNEELNQFWEGYLNANPELADSFHKASETFNTINFRKKLPVESERILLFDRIQHTILRTSRHKKIKRFIHYAAVACGFILVSLSLYIYTSQTSEKLYLVGNGQELFVGNHLTEEDIILMSENQVFSYNNQIQIKLNKKGNTEVKQDNNVELVNISENTINRLIVPFGKRSKVSLDDGSEILLSSGSTIEFPTHFNSETREIRLIKGEVYIDVKPDKKRSFILHTNELSIKVYGTKFNVSAHENYPTTIVLEEGKISLRTKTNNREIFLTPNELAHVTPSGEINKRIVNVDKYTSWKDGYLVFDKTPISEVLRQLEKYYNLSFEFDANINLNMRTCTGNIYLSDNVDNVMKTIALLTSMEYKKENNFINIFNK